MIHRILKYECHNTSFFVVAKNWKTPFSTWVVKLWYIHTMNYYRNKKEQMIDTCNNLDRSQGNYTEWKSQPQRFYTHTHTHTHTHTTYIFYIYHICVYIYMYIYVYIYTPHIYFIYTTYKIYTIYIIYMYTYTTIRRNSNIFVSLTLIT